MITYVHIFDNAGIQKLRAVLFSVSWMMMYIMGISPVLPKSPCTSASYAVSQMTGFVAAGGLLMVR